MWERRQKEQDIQPAQQNVTGVAHYRMTDEEALVQIPDEIRKCVGFVGAKVSAAGMSLRGTFFVVAHEGQLYAVTAAHVYEGVRRVSQDALLHLRINLKAGGSKWAYTRLNDWATHPTDQGIDVAACLIGIDGRVIDLMAIPMTMALTPEIITQQEIGLGDELFLTGLFSPHYGMTRNIPILRTGAIAAMPEEPVEWVRKTVEGNFNVAMSAYLVEARSIGGLSGSPVFIYVGRMRTRGGGTVVMGGGPTFYLLGLMHGHWDSPPDAAEVEAGVAEPSDARDSEEMRQEKVNMGIGIVVPADSIREVLDQPLFTARRQANLPTPDGSSDV